MNQLEEAYAAFQAWLDTDEEYQNYGDLLAAIPRYAAAMDAQALTASLFAAAGAGEGGGGA